MTFRKRIIAQKLCRFRWNRHHRAYFLFVFYYNLCLNTPPHNPQQVSLHKLVSLKKIYLNGNTLDFEGIPANIGKLLELQVFSASHNCLEMIPEGLGRYVICLFPLLHVLFFIWWGDGGEVIVFSPVFISRLATGHTF